MFVLVQKQVKSDYI